MKNKTLILTLGSLLLALSLSGQAVWEVSMKGTPDNFDREAALLLIDNENTRRAALEPPEDPLPVGTGAEIKASAEAALNWLINHEWMVSYRSQAAEKSIDEAEIRKLLKEADPVKRQAALTAALAELQK